ncbi:MAG: hypothetical protein WC011_01100 [Candidatus Paceibacterota bacterium]
MQNLSKVYPAEPYRPSQLGGFGKARYMFLVQFNFPDTYSEDDFLITVDHDRLNPDHVYFCFNEYLGQGPLYYAIEVIIRQTKTEKLFNFLIDIINVDKKNNWTGFRIMVTLGPRGSAIFTLELFSKNPKSNTKVYTGEVDAPNILLEPRNGKK